MAIDFPNSPTAGDTFTAAGKIYQYDGVVWEIYGPTVAPSLLKIDDVNNRIGINNETPSVALDVTGDTNTTGSSTIGGDVNVTGQIIGSNGISVDNGLTVDDIFYVDAINSRVGVNDSSPATSFSVTGDAVITGDVVAGGDLSGTLLSPYERWYLTAAAPAATQDIFTSVSTAWYFTVNATSNFVINITSDGSTSLDSLLSAGQTVTVSVLVTNGATPYYVTGVTVDSAAVTPEWQNGAAPSAGNASSIDVYTFSIIKTGSAAFTVLGSNTRFA